MPKFLDKSVTVHILQSFSGIQTVQMNVYVYRLCITHLQMILTKYMEVFI